MNFNRFPSKAFCLFPDTHFHTGLSFGFVLLLLRTHSLHTSQVWLDSVPSAQHCWRAVCTGIAYCYFTAITQRIAGVLYTRVFMSPLSSFFSSQSVFLFHTHKQKHTLCVFCPLNFLFIIILSSAGGMQRPAADTLKTSFSLSFLINGFISL